MNDLAEQVTINNPTTDVVGWVINFATDPKTWVVAFVCGVIAWAFKKLFDSLPKSVLVILVILGLIMAGVLRF